MYFSQKLVYFWVLFYKFYKKIADYLENENSHFVIFANGHGLTNMTTITQRHARKCSFDMTPVLSGYKVIWIKMTENDQKWPKMTENDQKWPKNGSKWPKMTENLF